MRSRTMLQSHFEAHELTGGQLTTVLTRAWCYRRAPHVSMEAMQSTSQPTSGRGISGYPSHGLPNTAVGACYMQWPSRGLEIWCLWFTASPHSGDRGIQILYKYCSVVKTTAGRPLTMGG